MKKIVLVIFAIFLLGIFTAQAGVEEFSADMISRSAGQTMHGKIYVGADKMRTEIEGSIMIARLDKNVSWIIMPSEKMYMEQAIDSKMLPKTPKDASGELERVSLGKDTVDGKSCEKSKVTYASGTSRETMYQWVTDSGFPIKMEAVDGSWSVEYKNVSIGHQSDDLFEVPSGYQKFSMPSMKDIMSQVNAQR